LSVARAADWVFAPDSAAAWRWRISARTLWVVARAPCRVLSWAPLGGGLRVASLLANHQVRLDDPRAARTPRAYLARVIRGAGYDLRRTVAMMTGAEVARAGHAVAARDGSAVGAWCTAGFSNALRVGDRGTVGPGRPGTINLIVMANRPMTRDALVEAIQIAAKARTLAILEAGVKSVRSGAPATGTGTDCIAIAAPIAGETASARGAGAGCAARSTAAARSADEERYCGKHTLLGELIGRAVLQSCARAIRRVR
jgi:adenosylcobinamide amidohydrolase